MIPSIPITPTCPHGHAGVINTTAKTVTHGDFASGLSIGGSGDYTFETGTYCITGNVQIGSIGSVNSPTSDVVWVMRNAGDTVNLTDLDYHFKSLDIYTTNGSFNLTNGATLYTDRLHFISSGTGNIQFGGGTTVTSLTGAMVPDAFFYLKGGKPDFNSGANALLHAPPSPDPFKGMLIYMPWSNQTPITFAGGTSQQFYGSIIVPHSVVTISGGSATVAYHSQFVAFKFDIGGGAYLNTSYNASENFGLASSPTVELVK
jgi:hypothetical protein